MKSISFDNDNVFHEIYGNAYSGGAGGGQGVLFLRAPSVKQIFGSPSPQDKKIFWRKIA